VNIKSIHLTKAFCHRQTIITQTISRIYLAARERRVKMGERERKVNKEDKERERYGGKGRKREESE